MRAVLVTLLLLAAGCSSLPADEIKAREFVERWGGTDPFENANITLETVSTVATTGRCFDGSTALNLNCHRVTVRILKEGSSTVLISGLSFKAILDNKGTSRGIDYTGNEFVGPGEFEATVSFDLPDGRLVTKITLGYLRAYAETDVPSYQVEELKNTRLVPLRFINATITPGRCIGGSDTGTRECHIIRVRVDNANGTTELSLRSYYFAGQDSNNLMQNPVDTDGVAVARGAKVNVTVRFEQPAETANRFNLIEYRDDFRALYGNVTIPRYAVPL